MGIIYQISIGGIGDLHMNKMIKIAGVLVAISMLAITLEACDPD